MRLFLVIAALAMVLVGVGPVFAVEDGPLPASGLSVSAVWQVEVLQDLPARADGGGDDDVIRRVALDPDLLGLRDTVGGLVRNSQLTVALGDGEPFVVDVWQADVAVEGVMPTPVVADLDWSPRFLDGDVTVVGTGRSEDGGSVGFYAVTYGDQLAVYMSSGSRVTEIRGDAATGYVLTERRAPVAKDVDPSGPLESQAAPGSKVSNAKAVFQPIVWPTYIDVLVATTNDSRAVAPTDELHARETVAVGNLANAVSSIDDVVFRLVGIYNTNATLPTDPGVQGNVNAEVVLGQLQDVGDPDLGGVHVARDFVNADVVLMFTDAIWYVPGGGGFIGGLAVAVNTDLTDPAAYGNMFGIADVTEPATTGLHEIGHTLGMRHDLILDSATVPKSYAHGTSWQSLPGPVSFQTIMGSSTHPDCDIDGDGIGDCAQAIQWSDPALHGSALWEDNARVLEEVAADAAAMEETFAQRLYRGSSGQWFTDRNDNGIWDGCTADLCETFGGGGVKPVIHPDGHLGFMDPTTGLWKFDRNGNGIVDSCVIDLCSGPFGGAAQQPFMWLGVNGAGDSEPRLGTVISGTWRRDGGNGSWSGCGIGGDTCLTFGLWSDRPFQTPDGNPGVFRPSTQQWFIDRSVYGSPGWGVWNTSEDIILGPFGASGDLPFMTADGQIGVYRPSAKHWFFDANGSGLWNGCGVDRCTGPMGTFGDLPMDRIGGSTLP